MKLYFAADHAGFEGKNVLIDYARSLGYEVEDCGAFEHDTNDDYPALIAAAARKLSADVAAGIDSRAIVAGASGQGEAMAANRFSGVRCAVYYGKAGVNQTDASGTQLDILASTRAHNNANALSFGMRFISIDEAKEVMKQWLETPFSGVERHARRAAALDGIAHE